jgi:peptidyl-prolyl cis-trans isomerase A (cyclophilin A)
MKFRRLRLLILMLAAALRLGAQTNGLFADFTTSLGNFSCSLDYTNAPKTVASFIGLATGQQAWLDLNTGNARTDPFYNGLTFHRVIAGFVIQTGSPNGQGTDGPGYVFQDEINPTNTFGDAGVLAMANSGADSNGSQFFITAAAQPSLNGNYAIFGHVVGGLDVVTKINNVATDANDKPKTNVVIQSIAIRRVGAAANAFDVHGQGLPVVTNPPVQLSLTGTNASLGFSNQLYADYRLFVTTNLTPATNGVTWASTELGIAVAGPLTNGTAATAIAPSTFYRLGQVQYPSSTFVPPNVFGRTLTMAFDGGNGTIVVTFDKSGGGTYTWTLGAPGTLTSYDWLQEAYVGRLSPIYYSALVPMVLRFDFTGPLAGKFTGTAYTASPFSVSGSFSLSP